MNTDLNINGLCDDPHFSVTPNLLKWSVQVLWLTVENPGSIDTHLNSIHLAVDVTDKIVCIMGDAWISTVIDACIHLVMQGGGK